MTKLHQKQPDRRYQLLENTKDYGIDELDRGLIRQLIEDPARRVQDIATNAGVVPRTASARLKRLFEQNYVKVIARKDLSLFGFKRICIVEFSAATPQLLALLADDLSVVLSFQCLLEDTLFVMFAFSDLDDLKRHIESLSVEQSEQLTFESTVFLDIRKDSFSFADMGFSAVSHSIVGGKTCEIDHPSCDEIDSQIISRLSMDARQGIRSIAQDVGLSEKAVSLRVKALTEKNLIRLGAITSSLFLGESFVVIGKLNTKLGHVDQLISLCANEPTIKFVATTMGKFDLYISSTSDSLVEIEQVRQRILPMTTRMDMKVVATVHSSRYDMMVI